MNLGKGFHEREKNGIKRFGFGCLLLFCLRFVCVFVLEVVSFLSDSFQSEKIYRLCFKKYTETKPIYFFRLKTV